MYYASARNITTGEILTSKANHPGRARWFLQQTIHDGYDLRVDVFTPIIVSQDKESWRRVA